MRLSQTITLSVVVVVLGSGMSLAQSPNPATPAPAPAAASDTDKKAISKECSAQAAAKGLHGKERQKFRADCKKNGGKPS
jgi:psiF repeat-containing protein